MNKQATLLVAALAAAVSSHAQNSSLFDMTLEELVNLEVTSVSRKAEPLAETTSAVHVITRDDIIRYGIRSVPEALRLVPGLSVLQIDSNKWAIGSRGSVGRFANKLLVLMDGRVLYTPSFSGVFWDVQDTMLEEIDRIEVIRGPGSTAWGSNAVNGVINIITRPADAAPGLGLMTDVENDGSYVMAARYAFGANDRHHRLFVKHRDADGYRDLAGFETADDWDLTRVGYRMDFSPSTTDEMTLIAEAYDGTMGTTQQFFTSVAPYLDTQDIDASVSGYFVVGRWDRQNSDRSASTVRLTIDDTDRYSSQFGEERSTYALDYQRQFTFSRHDLVFGAEYKINEYDFFGSETVELLPTSARDHLASAFIQNQFTLVEDKLDLIVGTKLERNDLSDRDVEVMPSVRLLWQTMSGPTVWASLTRSVRTPSWADRGARVLDIEMAEPPGSQLNPFPVPMRVAVVGSGGFRSEELQAFEIGLRGQIGSDVTYDLALFDMDYDELRAYTPSNVVCNPSGVSVFVDPLCVLAADSVVTELLFNNEGSGSARGAELAFDFDVGEKLRVRAAYAYTDESQTAPPPSETTAAATGPEHQAMLRTEWSVNESISLSAWVRYVDEIALWSLDDYWQASVQLNWQIDDTWRVSVGGKNLLDDRRVEYLSELNDVVPTQIESTYFVRAEWGF